MSIKVMTQVWDYSHASGTPLLVLLCLADWADDAGECWPSISTIRTKCRLKDDRHVKRVIHETLEEKLGEVVVIPGAGKASHKGGVRSNRYRITVHIPDDDQTVAEQPPSQAPDGGSETTPDGGSQTTQTVAEQPPEPSVDPPGDTSLIPASPKVTKRRAAQVPEDFAVTPEMRQWCATAGIRSDPLAETPQFIDHHRSRGTTFTDFVAAWRAWMRNADKFARNRPSSGDSRSTSMRNVDDVLGSITTRRQELTQ